jgi:hypothetical protein
MSKFKGILGNWEATSEDIRLAIAEGIYAALRKHKEKGVEAVTWREGRIVLIPPEEIQVPDEEDAASDPEVRRDDADVTN